MFARGRVLRHSFGMTIPAPLMILAAIAALIAIGPWMKVAAANDSTRQTRALAFAAVPTAIFLGLFVLGVAVNLVGEAI